MNPQAFGAIKYGLPYKKESDPLNHSKTTNPVKFTFPRREQQPEELLVCFHDDIISPQKAQDIHKIVGGSFLKSFNKNNTHVIKIPKGENIDELIARYQSFPQVKYAEPNYRVYPLTRPNDELYPKQWNYKMLNLEAAWQLTTGAPEILVAVLDTGIIPHIDLFPNPNDKEQWGNIRWDLAYNFVEENKEPFDLEANIKEESHGTHVAGIIGALVNNNCKSQMQCEGVAGITWQVGIIPLRVLGLEGGTHDIIARAIVYAVEKGAQIINMSLGGAGYSRTLEEACRYAYDRGVTIVAAAGNTGKEGVMYPAAFPEVIAVGAVGKNGERASYSSYGPEVDVAAPGGVMGSQMNIEEGILSTAGYLEGSLPHHLYTFMQGTSMACPHISGIIALLLSISQEIAPKQIKERLLKATNNTFHNNFTGHGIVDALRVLKDLPEPYIFAGKMVGNKIIMTSEGATLTGARYRIKDIKLGRSRIFAWIDVNEDGIINEGDYFAMSKIIKFGRYARKEVDLSLLPQFNEPGEAKTFQLERQKPLKNI